ncbi:hypothetical protein H5410_061244 [Solanum commersonii]|uniref:Uncharacterized protein n=1 Tax=Solanum commersonii TaxID=4109 RepID=A0A9J5W915_SOLCO|nr:hypothetical protein H5410_061244 [Solanum commersonii]
MTAASKVSLPLPRGLDRRIRCGRRQDSDFDSLSRKGKERQKTCAYALAIRVVLSVRVAALLPILVLDFQLHSVKKKTPNPSGGHFAWIGC